MGSASWCSMSLQRCARSRGSPAKPALRMTRQASSISLAMMLVQDMANRLLRDLGLAVLDDRRTLQGAVQREARRARARGVAGMPVAMADDMTNTHSQVVVGYDFSHSSNAALSRAIALAGRAPFHVLHFACI